MEHLIEDGNYNWPKRWVGNAIRLSELILPAFKARNISAAIPNMTNMPTQTSIALRCIDFTFLFVLIGPVPDRNDGFKAAENRLS